MSKEYINEIASNYKKFLDDVADHTKKKVEYIKEYVKHWLLVGCNYEKCTTLNFIDCMCNAGVYADGTKGTSIEVFELFLEFANTYKHKTFNLLLNDINKDRIDIIEKIISNYDIPKNVNYYVNNKDVNDYIVYISRESVNHLFSFGKLSILFVDPYNFGTVKIKTLIDFLSLRRCELIYNYFISDYRRNHANKTVQQKVLEIKTSLKGVVDLDIESVEGEELLHILHKNIKERTQINYVFSYPFKIRTNAKLYYILFATPSPKGLIKIKDALWNVFDGNDCFRNPNKSCGYEQLSLDLEDYDKINKIMKYSNEAISILKNKISGITVSFKQIEEIVLEYTMLKSDQIISNVLKPLISRGIITKAGDNRSYKNNYYTWK